MAPTNQPRPSWRVLLCTVLILPGAWFVAAVPDFMRAAAMEQELLRLADGVPGTYGSPVHPSTVLTGCDRDELWLPYQDKLDRTKRRRDSGFYELVTFPPWLTDSELLCFYRSDGQVVIIRLTDSVGRVRTDEHGRLQFNR